MITLDTSEITPMMQLQRFNDAVTSAKHGNGTAIEGNNCSRKIQDKHSAVEETRHWIYDQIMKMLAPPQPSENV